MFWNKYEAQKCSKCSSLVAPNGLATISRVAPGYGTEAAIIEEIGRRCKHCEPDRRDKLWVGKDEYVKDNFEWKRV
jgi:hypothetical protein